LHNGAKYDGLQELAHLPTGYLWVMLGRCLRVANPMCTFL
jgi:hypothetical protein